MDTSVVNLREINGELAKLWFSLQPWCARIGLISREVNASF